MFISLTSGSVSGLGQPDGEETLTSPGAHTAPEPRPHLRLDSQLK